MAQTPCHAASSADFEFAALEEARNYRQAIFREFGPYLGGAVLEVGAGIGQLTELQVGMPGVTRVLAVEPDPAYCERHRKRCPRHEILQGTSLDVPAGTRWNAILSVNVLEHIFEDEPELKRYAQLLGEQRGALCLFVPARPEIYAPIDKDFGHHRRYTSAELRRKLTSAGFDIVRLNYFNSVGYFAWWANFCLLKQRHFTPAKVRTFDRLIFPAVHAFESRVFRPPFGQSLIAVARSRAAC